MKSWSLNIYFAIYLVEFGLKYILDSYNFNKKWTKQMNSDIEYLK